MDPLPTFAYFAPQASWYPVEQIQSTSDDTRCFPHYQMEQTSPTSSSSHSSSYPQTHGSQDFVGTSPRIPSPPPIDHLPITKPKAKRAKVNSNLKERRRNSNINEAFRFLQGRIPNTPSPYETPLPKIKTLRLAISYIRELEGVLAGGGGVEDLSHLSSAFAASVAAELQTRNSYKHRAERLLKGLDSESGPMSTDSPPHSLNSTPTPMPLPNASTPNFY